MSLFIPTDLVDVFFPVPSIKGFKGEILHPVFVQATNIDVVAIRMRAWLVEGVDSAMLAEMVLCDLGAESIGR